MGIRPEHFEDAALLNGKQDEGLTFAAVVDVLESLGADKYAYFRLQGARATAQELEELAADAGTRDAPGGSDQVVARLDPASRARGPAAAAVVRPPQAAPVQPRQRGPPHPLSPASRPVSGPRGRSAPPGPGGDRPRPRAASAWSGCCACFSTVPSVTHSCRAMPALERPSAIWRPSTSRSRALRAASGSSRRRAATSSATSAGSTTDPPLAIRSRVSMNSSTSVTRLLSRYPTRGRWPAAPWRARPRHGRTGPGLPSRGAPGGSGGPRPDPRRCGSGHPDVDHHELGRLLGDQGQQLGGVAGLAHDLEPERWSGLALARQNVVLGQDHPATRSSSWLRIMV